MKTKLMLKDIISPRLFSLLLQTKTIEEIANEYSVSRQAIYNLKSQYEKKYPELFKKKNKVVFDKEDIKKNLQMMSIKQYCKINRINYYELYNFMKNNGITKPQLSKNILDKNTIKHMYNDLNMTDSQIAKIFNCSSNTISSFRWNNNIYNMNRQWRKKLTKDEFLKLFNQNKLSLYEISDYTGFPYHIIVKAKNEYMDNSEQKK